MDVTCLCKGCLYFRCDYNNYRPPSIVPGQDIKIPKKSISKFGFKGHIVKDLPSDQVLLLDTRCALVKIISDDCQFAMPASNDEWEVVKPIFKELAERRWLILSEVSHKCYDFSAVKAKCRKSFYSSTNGLLINNTFEWDRLTPDKMAGAGLKFVGDASNDTVACYFNPKHQMCNWGAFDKPVSRHVEAFHCLCIEDKKYNIPIMSFADGQKFPVVYKLHIRDEHFSSVCDDAFLITHSAAPVKIAPWSDIMSKVDEIRIGKIEANLLDKKPTVKADDVEHFELLKQSITLTHFSELLRDYELVRHDFIGQLEKYKAVLHAPADLITADGLLEKLSSSSVLAEVGEAVNKLATLKLVKRNAALLGFLPPATHKAINDSVELVIIKELQELAEFYRNRYFVDDFLNGLVTDGTLGCLFTRDYFTSPTRSDQLILLLDKGNSCSHLLVCVSQTIRKLLEPFMPEQVESEINDTGFKPHED